MLNDYEEKINNAQGDLDRILKLIAGEWQKSEIHEVENNLFKHLLAMGSKLLQVYVAKKGTGRKMLMRLPYHKTECWTYISVFGKLNIPRAYFWEKGGKGVCPIMKSHNAPKCHFSYVLQKWSQMLAVESSYDKSREVLNEILGRDIWSGQMEAINVESAASVDSFYDDMPREEQKEDILVAEIDGKGIVMRKGNKRKPGERLTKGKKNGTKKMSTVTAVYGIDRNIRDVDDIIKQETEDDSESLKLLESHSKEETKPQNKIVRATLEGKDLAFERLSDEIARRDPEGKKDHIALMDGEVALEKKTKEFLPGFTIILDLFHVMEKLWDICYFFCEEGSQEALEWVKKYLHMFLTGKVGYAIGGIRQSARKKGFDKRKLSKIETILGYFAKRKDYMRYDEYLAKGYPIGSGVIEGTCRSFVKDRMELSGMRWSEKGAEAMLELRSIKVNGIWDEYWNDHILRRKTILYGSIPSHDNSLKKAA